VQKNKKKIVVNICRDTSNQCAGFLLRKVRVSDRVVQHGEHSFTGSGARSSPPVHTAMALTRWQSTWCYSAKLMTRSGGTSGQEENSMPLGLTQTDRGGDLPPLPPSRNERERSQLGTWLRSHLH